jgi:hypothetical protein
MERRLFERLESELGPDWSVIHDCEIRAAGEIGTVDFLLVHHAFGIALLGLAGTADEGEPAAAAAAMRTMLNELGFTRRFAGEMTIVARTLRGDEPGSLADRLFGGERHVTISDPTWPDWLIHRLVPVPETLRGSAAQTAIGARLRAPSREEAWRVAEARMPLPGALGAAPSATTQPIDVAAPERPIAAASPPARRSLGLGMALSVIVVGIVLVGMALLSHGNGPARPPVAQSTASTPQ